LSTVGDAFQALKQVLLIHANVERLERSVDKLGDDVDGLAQAVGGLRDRVSRLEGFIDGAAAAAKHRPRLKGE
jgi:t-SNARE complex subunit (syntaxin)